MATLAVQIIDRPGIVLTFDAAAVGGDSFPNTGKEFVQFKNDDGSPTNVTVVTTQIVDGNAVEDLTVTAVPASGQVEVGPFFTSTYGSTVSMTYTSVTSLGVAVKRLS